MQIDSHSEANPTRALRSLLECRDRAREIARHQHDRLRAIRANTSAKLVKENHHD